MTVITLLTLTVKFNPSTKRQFNMSLGHKFTTEELIKKGRTTKDNIETIKEWINNLKLKHIPIIPDEMVAIFLLSCSNNIEETKKTIEIYYTLKKSCPALFDDRFVDGEEFNSTPDTVAFAPVYWPEENAYIMYCKFLDVNYRKCNMTSQLKLAIMTMDSLQYENPPSKIYVVQDITGMSLMHLTLLKLDILKSFFSYIQDGLPLQLEGVHYINSNYILNKFMVIAKLFMKPELYHKTHFHSGTDDLHDLFPKHCIPSDYNGKQDSMLKLQNDSIATLKNMDSYWNAEEKMRKDALLRKD